MEAKLAIREFQCLQHGIFERIDPGLKILPRALCPVCGKEAEFIEFSVPARRDPERGIQK